MRGLFVCWSFGVDLERGLGLPSGLHFFLGFGLWFKNLRVLGLWLDTLLHDWGHGRNFGLRHRHCRLLRRLLFLHGSLSTLHTPTFRLRLDLLLHNR
jgi:hypothetical protein